MGGGRAAEDLDPVVQIEVGLEMSDEFRQDICGYVMWLSWTGCVVCVWRTWKNIWQLRSLANVYCTCSAVTAIVFPLLITFSDGTCSNK